MHIGSSPHSDNAQIISRYVAVKETRCAHERDWNPMC